MTSTGDTNAGVAAGGAAERVFAEALTELRVARRLSMKQLAAKMGFHPSYVSHVESGRFHPTPEFARRAEVVLAAEGRLDRAYAALSGAEPTARMPSGEPANSEIRIESDQAELVLDPRGFYSMAITRRIRNTGAQPITWFPVRIEVDVAPEDPVRSRQFYRQHPLTMAATKFWAQVDGWPTSWVLRKDCDAYKKVQVVFGQSPIYPGEQATIAYGYRVHASQWGAWLEREIRWPTDLLSVSLAFPPGAVTGLRRAEATLAGDRLFGEEAARLSRHGESARYLWSVAKPELGAMYRFDWDVPARRGTGYGAAA